MPSRLMSAAILALWIVAVVALVRRDFLPRWVVGPPPNLKALAKQPELPKPSAWAILVPEPKGGERVVGRLVTEATRLPEGGLRLASKVVLDAGSLLQGTAFRQAAPDTQLAIDTQTDLDAKGELQALAAEVREATGGATWLTLSGQRAGERIVIAAHGADGAIRLRESFPYIGGGQVQQSFGPPAGLRGLIVGQSWDSHVINPITGTVQPARVEVKALRMIRWQGKMAEALEVVSELKPFVARTWVRPRDGEVLRQEIPIPFVKLVLERLPHPAAPGNSDLSP